jgi:hypothetical protein
MEQYIVADQRHPNATRVRDEPKPSVLVLTIPHQSLTLWLYVSSCIDVVLINAMMILNTFPRCRVEPKARSSGSAKKGLYDGRHGKGGVRLTMLSPFIAKCSIGILSRRRAQRSALSDSVLER